MSNGELKFYLLADPHYFDSSLGCAGEEYEDFMHYEQKCFAETESINKSVFGFLKEADGADTVLIAGDLSFNGEKKSHESFIKLLGELKDSGKRVFVLTADHDYCDEPFAFSENGRYTPDGTKREELFDLYYDFGFSEAVSVDRETLSYSADLSDTVRLLALNADKKFGNRHGFDDRQKEWIAEEARKAEKSGKTLIAMCHYPILSGQPIFSLVSPLIFEKMYETASFLADLGIHLVFTGHMHNQSINEYVSEKGNRFYDVTTGAVIADPAYIRLVSVNGNTAKIESIPTPSFDFDTGGKDCKQYLTDMFDRMIVNLITDMANDTQKAMRKLGIKDTKPMKLAIKLAGKLICSVKMGTLARLFFIKCDRSIRKIKLIDYSAELVREVFKGNQSFMEGTAKGDVFLRFLKRINPVLKRINLKNPDGTKADLFDILKNTAGNYGIDDYNAVLTLYDAEV